MTGIRKALLSAVMFFLMFSVSAEALAAADGWERLQEKYRSSEKVRQLICVRYIEESRARLQLYVKLNKYSEEWRLILSCEAAVGDEGIGKEQEGDLKTPVGDFGIVTACGLEDNPGLGERLPYVKFDEHIYIGGEGANYNRLIDDRQTKIGDNDSDFINLDPHYNYALLLDYNQEQIPGKGGGIFIHCRGDNPWTHGCVAIREKDLLFLMQNIDKNARVLIYPLAI